MLDPMLHNFFERFDGVSYSIDEDLHNIYGNKIFIEPYEWQVGINTCLEVLDSALKCIDKNAQYLTEDMPDKKSFEKIVSNYVLAGIMSNLNAVKNTLNINATEITNFESLEKQLYLVGKLVEMLVENDLETLLADDVFNTYITEEGEDNEFVTVLGLDEKDVPNLSFVVSSIREEYFESLDDEDE